MCLHLNARIQESSRRTTQSGCFKRKNKEKSPHNRIRLANAYRNLAMIYRCLKKKDAAYGYQRMVIDILEDVFSDNKQHPDLPIAYSVYSFILRDMGDVDGAIKYQYMATQISESKIIKILNWQLITIILECSI